LRRLILDRPPAHTCFWLGEAPFRLEAPARAALALHLPRAAPLATLIAGDARLPGALLAAGWVELPTRGGALLLRAESAPIALSLGTDGRPALRAWEGMADAPWQAAKIWGRGAVVALGAGRARPVLRLAAGEAAWVTLPLMEVLPAPRLVALRGPLPRAGLHWGLPHAPLAHGPGPVTLRLRAGLGCDVMWDG
jgi:hypothetical protein